MRRPPPLRSAEIQPSWPEDAPHPPAVVTTLTDDTPVKLAEIGSGDFAAVRALHRGMSPDDLYLRFFGGGPRLADETAERLCRLPGPGHAAVGAWAEGRLAGVADYETAGSPFVAEIALAVADGMHHRGVGTLLLGRLISLARSRGIRELRADALVQNSAVLHVLFSAGTPVLHRCEGGVVEITMPLTPDGREKAPG